MTDKQNYEIKATFLYGHELLTGKKTKYEFVKQDFDNDIDVPSKQIIIDEKCPISEKCKEFNNCKIQSILQQLKAKEQECEELREKCKKYGEINEQETKDYAELKAELEQEKNWHKVSDEISKANSEYTAKLKQTLVEIKEITESEMDSKEIMAIQCMLNGSVDNKNKVFKQILQKISEVEDDNA